MSQICRVWLRWMMFSHCSLVILPHSNTRHHSQSFTNLHSPPFSGDVYIFIKIKSSPSGPSPHVYVWRGRHSSPSPLLAWSRCCHCISLPIKFCCNFNHPTGNSRLIRKQNTGNLRRIRKWPRDARHLSLPRFSLHFSWFTRAASPTCFLSVLEH